MKISILRPCAVFLLFAALMGSGLSRSIGQNERERRSVSSSDSPDNLGAIKFRPGHASFRNGFSNLVKKSSIEAPTVVAQGSSSTVSAPPDDISPPPPTTDDEFSRAIVNFTSEERNVKSEVETIDTAAGEDPNYYEEVDRKKKEKEIASFARIMGINNHVSVTGTFEGDMKFDRTRNAASSDKWPKDRSGRYRGLVRIPYKVSSRYNRSQLSIIRSAMKVYTDHTCIRFLPRTSSDYHYIAIKDGKGCWAYVGKTGLTEQTVSLGIPGCVSKGIAAHELMHVVGFQHEHSRSDRDKHVRIINYNIQNDMALNFARYNDTINLVVYDYNSVMHYGATAFSKQPYLPSIQIIPKRKPEPFIGQRERMSPYDIEEIKYLYKCAPGTYKRCGKDFVTRSGSFNSPNYPAAYPLDAHCTWNITVRPGFYVSVTFQNVDVKDSPLCQQDAILVHNGINAAAPVLETICGKQRKDRTVVSTGRSMFIIFSSDGRRDTSKGFRATFTEVRRPGKVPLPMTTPTLPPIINPVNSFSCNFERGTCGMTQDTLDELNWNRHRGSTPSRYTGPTGDHTTGTGYYMYVEASDPAGPGDNAVIRTPWMRRSTRCISFAYNMYGRLMGSLRLYAFEKRSTDRYGHEVLLWEEMGDQGLPWKTADYTYRPRRSVQNVQFYWEVYVNFYQSDAAIDDIVITAGRCGASTTVPNVISWTTKNKPTTRSTTTVAPTPAVTTRRVTTKPRVTTTIAPTLPPLISELKCSFDHGLCGWIQSDRDIFDWTLRRGKTPSHSTGPTEDHTSGAGQYIYIEASSPRRDGHMARLVSPPLTATTHCFQAWYHMYGKQINKLKISQYVNSVTKTLLEIEGDKGDEWRFISTEVNSAGVKKSGRYSDRVAEEFGEVPGRIGNEGEEQPPVENEEVIERNPKIGLAHDSSMLFDQSAVSYHGVRVIIDGTTGDGYAGDIALDDVTITDGPCSSPSVTVRPTLLTKLKCNFEEPRKMCGIRQVKTDDFDWTQHSGSTPSSGTGPRYDHTLERESGVYLYIETSGPNRKEDQVAELITPKFATAQYCVRFFAHMQGSGMGALLMYSLEDIPDKASNQPTLRWSVAGDQGQNWFQGKFDFTAKPTARSVRFIIQGKVGPTFTSDVAIDDFSVTAGSCSGPTTIAPTTARPTTTPTTRTTTTTPTTTTTTTTPTTTTTTTTPTTTPTTTTPTTTTTTTTPTTTTTTTTPTTTTTTTTPTTTTTTTIPTTTTPTTTTTTTTPTTTTTTTTPTTTTTTTTPTTTTTTKAPTTTKTTTTPTTTPKAKATTVGQASLQQAKLLYPTSFSCNFDTRGLCGISQLTNDKFDWVRRNGKSPSSGTGPSADHTEKTRKGYYMYIEASAPRKNRETAGLKTPKMSVSTSKRCVTFWYHMYGSGTGSLELFAQFLPSASARKSAGTRSSRRSVFRKGKEQGTKWIMGRVEIDQDTSYLGGSVNLQFIATRGISFRSDIAIDDICSAEGPCNQQNLCSTDGVLRSTVPAMTTMRPTTAKLTTTTKAPTTTSTTTTTTTTTVSNVIPLNANMGVGMPMCTFAGVQTPTSPSRQSVAPTFADRNLDLGKFTSPKDQSGKIWCGFQQLRTQDKFDWRRRSGRTPSRDTGPTSDHTTGTGFYAYIESSSPRIPNDVAMLQTYKMYPTPYCVTMSYHMYGKATGRLTVRTLQKLQDGRSVLSHVKSLIGNKGNSWKQLQIDYTPRVSAVDVAFRVEAAVGGSFTGDIAFDDFSVVPGQCDECNKPSHTFTNNLRQKQNFSTGCVHPTLFYVRCCSHTKKQVVYRRVANCNKNMFTKQMLNWLC